MSKGSILRVLYFLTFCCTAAWLPLLVDFCKSQGLSATKASMVNNIVAIMMLLVQPLYGMLSDRIGYKKTMLISSLFASLSYLGYLYKQDFGWLLFITALMSLFYNAIQPVLDSLSLQLAREDKKFSYGSLRIAGAAGWAVTSIITGQVIDAVSFKAIFIVSAVTMFLVFIFSWFLQDIPQKESSVHENPFAHFREVITNRSLLFLLFCVFLVSACAATIWYFYSVYMKENGASASLVGYGLSFQGLCELPLFYFSARIIARLGLKTTLIITVLATTIRMLLYSVIKNPVAVIPVEILHGLSWSLFWVVCVEFINRLVNKNWMATGQSLLYAAYFGAGTIAGTFWAGYLSDNNMKIATIFLLNSAIIFVVAILLWLFMKKPANNGQTAATNTV